MSDQLVAEAATYTTDAHPRPQRDSNPRPKQSSGLRSMPQTARPPGRVVTNLPDDNAVL